LLLRSDATVLSFEHDHYAGGPCDTIRQPDLANDVARTWKLFLAKSVTRQLTDKGQEKNLN
jgi:hypothetical protein